MESIKQSWIKCPNCDKGAYMVKGIDIDGTPRGDSSEYPPTYFCDHCGMSTVVDMHTERQPAAPVGSEGAGGTLEYLAEQNYNAANTIDELRATIKQLKADLQHGIFPGWQSYEQWVNNGRQALNAASDSAGE